MSVHGRWGEVVLVDERNGLSMNKNIVGGLFK